jgi:hypothetical protein
MDKDMLQKMRLARPGALLVGDAQRHARLHEQINMQAYNE